MVWGLFPIDSLRGAQEHYIFSKGTYKVGRKDCDIIIQTDTAVSRIHAEIVIDTMTSRDSTLNGSASFLSYVRIRDHSKYGTFINKETGTKAVRTSPDKEATLNDGDLVSFGTGNATFRFCFVPLVIFIHCPKPMQVNSSLQATISSMGGCTTCNWRPECTHVLADESSPITLDLIEAVVAKKTVVRNDWVKVLAEKHICTEFPCCTSYVPTLTLEGMSVKIVEPKSREKCLEGYTFVLGLLEKYKFRNKLQLLLEAVGAKFLHSDEFCSNSQTSAHGETNPFVLVIPGGSPNEFNHLRQLSSLSRVTDMKLVAAILSGHLDSSTLEPPSIVVLSSHSTDETIVADSDVEIDTATSIQIVATTNPQKDTNYEYEDKEDAEKSEDKEDAEKPEDKEDAEKCEYREHARKYEDKEKDDDYSYISSEKIKIPSPKYENIGPMKKLDKCVESDADEHQNSDIIYSQDLIVRNITRPGPARPVPKEAVNFKCFRKRQNVSGNSFNDLVRFSKDPYKESDRGNNESAEYMREEKKRKQMEAIAEDLFNNEKAKKRAVAGTSLDAFLARR